MTPVIRTLAPGELISENGFYNIPLSVHHGQPCIGPSVTSGVLRKMELHSAADVWAYSRLNPNRYEDEDKPALRLGRAMAAYVEGGMDAVAQHFRVLPEDKPRRPTAQQIASYEAGTATETGEASVEFWRAVEADPRDELSAAELAQIEAMGKVLAADPAAAAVMGGIPEVTMAYLDDRTGLWVLSRPDTVNFDGSVTDYKRVSAQGRPFSHRLVDQRITEHGYDMQLALAAEAFETLAEQWPSIACITAQSDKPPYHVILREILEEDLRIGQWRNRRALNRFAECLASGHWPGPGEDTSFYQRPDWQRTMLLEQMNTEGVAP
jgi:hypothetical protein